MVVTFSFTLINVWKYTTFINKHRVNVIIMNIVKAQFNEKNE